MKNSQIEYAYSEKTFKDLHLNNIPLRQFMFFNEENGLIWNIQTLVCLCSDKIQIFWKFRAISSVFLVVYTNNGIF